MAAKRGDLSFCGIPIPSEQRASIAAGDTTMGVLTDDEVGLATCLYEEGYLSQAGLAAVEQYARERNWRWWEKGLWSLSIAAVGTGLSYLVFRWRPPSARAAPA